MYSGLALLKYFNLLLAIKIAKEAGMALNLQSTNNLFILFYFISFILLFMLFVAAHTPSKLPIMFW